MNVRLLFLSAASAALALAAPAVASAQHRSGHDRPVHVVTDRGHGHGWHGQSASRQALRRAEDALARVDASARPFDEPDSERHISRAADSVRAARRELGPLGNERRFWVHLEDADREIASAEARVRVLARELANLRDDADRAVARADDATRRGWSGRADRLADSARDELADGRRAERRLDYTDARAHYAAAISAARDASALAARPAPPRRDHHTVAVRYVPDAHHVSSRVDRHGHDGCGGWDGDRESYGRGHGRGHSR